MVDWTYPGLFPSLEGNTGDNDLRGLDGADSMTGGLGDDRLFGGADADRLEGESGADLILMESGDVAFGGSGQDSFRFNGEPLGNAGSGDPVIRDFAGIAVNDEVGTQDKLVFAAGLEVGSFSYIGEAAFSGGGNSEARFNGPRQIQVDQDGDGSTDQAFQLDGITAANRLTSSDFIWL